MENEDIGHVSYWASMYSLVAQVRAIDARLEGMRVENHARFVNHEALAYTEEAFENMACELDQIAELLGNI